MQLDDQRTAANPSLADKAREMTRAILPAVVLLLPLTSNTVAESSLSWMTVLVGAMLIVLLLATLVVRVARRAPTLSPAVAAGWVLPPVMLLSFLLTPSDSGSILIAFGLFGLGVVLAIAAIEPERLPHLVALPLLITASIQSILVIAQTLTDRAIGLTLIEPEAELRFIDGLLRSQGTMHHVYEPAALALLAAGIALITSPTVPARWLWVWAAGAGLAGSTIGLTHSRAALLGLLLMLPFVATGIRRQLRFLRVIGSALLIGFLVAAAFTASAWALRGDHSTTGDLDDASLGRVTLIKQAVTMATDHPLLGVGPGRYLEALENEYELDEDYPFIVHNVTLAVAAENGIAVAVVASLLVAWALLRAVREGPLAGALAAAPVGFLIFDVLHYNRPVGLLMMAIWLGVLHTTDHRESIGTRRTTPA